MITAGRCRSRYFPVVSNQEETLTGLASFAFFALLWRSAEMVVSPLRSGGLASDQSPTASVLISAEILSRYLSIFLAAFRPLSIAVAT